MDDIPPNRRDTSRPDSCVAHGYSNKAQLRAFLHTKRAEALPDARLHASRLLCQRIASLSCYQESHTVGLYWATRGEIDPVHLTELSTATGKTFAWPRTHVRARKLTFHTAIAGPYTPGQDGFVSQIADAFEPGAYGIDEPTGPEIALEKLDILIVPGLGFDPFGHRIGHGKGFYDRLLARCAHRTATVGVGFDWQLVDGLPTEAHDLPVHFVATPSKLISAQIMGSRLDGTTLLKEI